MSLLDRDISEAEDRAYRAWKRHGNHLLEYASELVETGAMMFCIVGIVALMSAHDSPIPRLLPSHALRLLVNGLFTGLVIWLIAASPPGKLSGAHLNPAVSLGFWLLGKMHWKDLLGYVTAQCAGGIAGAAAAEVAFGDWTRQVKDAALHTAPGVGAWAALGAEAGCTLLLTGVVYTFVSRKSLTRLTPAAVTFVLGITVLVDGGFSGCGMNPARWLGPACMRRDLSLAWVYVAGPLAGAVLAAGLRQFDQELARRPHTGKLMHDPGYRSIFLNDREPSTPPPACAQAPPQPSPQAN